MSYLGPSHWLIHSNEQILDATNHHLSVTSILDDLVFTPIIHYYYTQTVASKTIDKREAAESASIIPNSGD